MTVSAHAAYYTYSSDNPSGTNGGGDIKNISTSYSTTGIFSWKYTIEDKNDGFWLVVSDGPNPKGTADQLAILYGDLNNNKLTAYRYSGQNNPNSYLTPGDFLQQWNNAFTTVSYNPGEETTSFSIDVSGINSKYPAPDWEGTRFGGKIGIWFHTTADSEFSYEKDQITDFDFEGHGWHDSRNKTTTEEPLDPNEIPAPSALFLLGLGLLGMTYARRNKAA